MRQRRRLEESITMDEDLGRRVGDINAYFDLAREGEAVIEELRKEIDELRDITDKLETRTLRRACFTTRPNGSIEAVVPLFVASSTQRWFSMARMRDIWRCCQGALVSPYQRSSEILMST